MRFSSRNIFFFNFMFPDKKRKLDKIVFNFSNKECFGFWNERTIYIIKTYYFFQFLSKYSFYRKRAFKLIHNKILRGTFTLYLQYRSPMWFLLRIIIIIFIYINSLIECLHLKEIPNCLSSSTYTSITYIYF